MFKAHETEYIKKRHTPHFVMRPIYAFWGEKMLGIHPEGSTFLVTPDERTGLELSERCKVTYNC